MTSIANNSVARIAAIALGLVLAFSAFAPVAHAAGLTEAQIQAIIQMVQSFGVDAGTVANVNASLRGQAITPSPTTGGACPALSRSLQQGISGADVLELQVFLNGYSTDTRVSISGAGSPGSETTYFGPATHAAVVKFQAKNNVSPIGIVGPQTRAAIVAVCGSITVTPPTTPVVPAGTGLSVVPGTQPANSLAPQGAVRVPFTRFIVTAGSDGDVVVNGVVIARTGLGQDAAFAGVILIDDATGRQLGTAKTFNSNHQATIGEAVTIPRGTSKTFLVAGNMNAALTSYAGEGPSLSVLSINTTAIVTGSFPIVGANHTMNASLSVGALTMASSNSFAANSASTTKEIGTTGFKASGLRLTASSAEDIRLRSIRMNQVGSVGVADIGNVVINVAGTAYPAVASADGKYYEAVFGSGIVIGKGNNVEVYTQYDILGGSARTIIFHVNKSTDVYATGETYTHGAATSGLNTNDPFYFGQQVTVSGGSATSIQKSNTVAAQNITPNVPNQPLGGFETDIKGEAISVQSMTFTISTSTGWNSEVTNVTLVDENGAVVAGPVDASGASETSLVFSDTVTFKTGKHIYTLRGKGNSSSGGGITNGSTISIATTPSTGWTTVIGETTGNTISLSANGNFSMNTMTIKSGAITVTRGTSPSSKTIIAGASNFPFVTLQFDASQSGEDIRFSSIPLSLTFTGNSEYNDTLNCQVYDGGTSISDSPINPSGTATTSAYTATATLSSPVTVTKGTKKVLEIRCNVATDAVSTGGYGWDHGTVGNFTFTGLASAQTITGTAPADTAVTMTVGTGALSVSTHSSSPSYKLVSAGSTDVVSGVYQITASNEEVNLTELAVALSSYASSSISDIGTVLGGVVIDSGHGSIWDGAIKIGDLYFTTDGGSGAVSIATSTFTSALVLKANSDKVLTLKLDLATIGNNAAATSSGKFIAVNFNALKGVGVDSGTTYDNGDTTGSTAVSGIRMMKSFPTVSAETIGSTNGLTQSGLSDGKLGRFKVTADSHGTVGLTEFNLRFATTTAVLTNVNIYAYEDPAYTLAVSGVAANGAVNLYGQPLGAFGDAANAWKTSSTNFEFTVTDTAGASTTLQVPAGATRYFEIRGTVTGSAAGASVVTTLVGDSAASFSGLDGIEAGRLSNTLGSTTAEALSTVGKAAFIWSPNSTTTATRGHDDWTNAYGVPGLGSNGLIFNRSH